MSNHLKLWTQEEDIELIFLMGSRMSINKISEKMNRSRQSIIRRIDRLNCRDRHVETGSVSLSMLSKCLGVSFKKILRLTRKHGLPAKKYYLNDSRSKNQPYYVIPQTFWKWASNHQKEFDWRKYKKGTLIPEPSWLDEAIEKSKDIPLRTKQYWTDEEDVKLIQMYYYRGMKQKEIAKQMNRSPNSIEKRIARIRRHYPDKLINTPPVGVFTG